jgi:hypothetical protein
LLDNNVCGGRLLPLRSWRPKESHVESSEHQDNANIHYQPFPESVSEERGATLQRPGWAGNNVGFYPNPTELT